MRPSHYPPIYQDSKRKTAEKRVGQDKPAPATTPSGATELLIALQRSAGNTAVNQLLRQYTQQQANSNSDLPTTPRRAPLPQRRSSDVWALLSGQNPEQLAQSPAMEAATRHAASPLQRSAYGASTTSVPSAAVSPIIQRYTVPADLDCGDVVDWLNSNSPYSPEWAETRCSYSVLGQLRLSFANQPDGTVQATATGHPGMRVTVNCPIDRPQWSPSQRPGRADVVSAWSAMRATLDAHENQHRAIGEAGRATMEGRARNYTTTATGASRDEARQAVAVAIQADEQQWQADAQADQDAIDPFRGALLTCP